MEAALETNGEMMKIIKQPLGLIDHSDTQSDEINVLKVDYEMFRKDGKVSYLFVKGAHLVFSTYVFNKLKKVWVYVQEEYPLKSLPWIIDRIENGFWKRPADGGLSDFERSVSKEFDGETIGINAVMHCCAENMPGYSIWNVNRECYITNTTPQEWEIPSYMLKEGLLDELKVIADKYC